MAKTYAEFKTWLSTFLWKENDASLVASLDDLIRMADADLDRSLDIQRRNMTISIAPETEDYTLPSDFRHMISLTDNRSRLGTAFDAAPVSYIYQLRAQTDSFRIMPYYAIDQGTLRLVGPFSESDPGDLTLHYRASIPDYQTDDASWVEDEFFDLYTYAVLIQTAPFLREDERLPVWERRYVGALTSSVDESKRHIEHGGSPRHLQPHHPIPRRKSRRR